MQCAPPDLVMKNAVFLGGWGGRAIVECCAQLDGRVHTAFWKVEPEHLFEHAGSRRLHFICMVVEVVLGTILQIITAKLIIIVVVEIKLSH